MKTINPLHRLILEATGATTADVPRLKIVIREYFSTAPWTGRHASNWRTESGKLSEGWKWTGNATTSNGIAGHFYFNRCAHNPKLRATNNH